MFTWIHIHPAAKPRTTLVILWCTLVLGLPAGATLGSIVKVRVDLSPEGQGHPHVCATLAEDDDPASRLAVEVSGETETREKRRFWLHTQGQKAVKKVNNPRGQIGRCPGGYHHEDRASVDSTNKVLGFEKSDLH